MALGDTGHRPSDPPRERSPADAAACDCIDTETTAPRSGCDTRGVRTAQPEAAVPGLVDPPIDGRSGTINWGDAARPRPRSIRSAGQRNAHVCTRGHRRRRARPGRTVTGGRLSAQFQVKVVDLRSPRGRSFTALAGTPSAAPSRRSPTPNTERHRRRLRGRRSTGATAPPRRHGPRLRTARFVVTGTHTYASAGSLPGRGHDHVRRSRVGQLDRARDRRRSRLGSGTRGHRHAYGERDGRWVLGLGESGRTPTTASFQYGLDPKYTGGGPIVYSNSTPAQTVGLRLHEPRGDGVGVGARAERALPRQAGRPPTAPGPPSDRTSRSRPAKAPTPGSPTLGKTFNISPVSGIVLVKVNGEFVPLTELTQIPKNTVIDALHGTLSLTTAARRRLCPAPTMPPRRARSTSRSPRRRRARSAARSSSSARRRAAPARASSRSTIVEGAAFKGAPTYATCKKPRKGRRRLGRRGLEQDAPAAPRQRQGQVQTSGRYAAATVRGTKWTIADRCDGTLTHDITDSVAVTDFVHHKTIILHAGQSYLAKAPERDEVRCSRSSPHLICGWSSEPSQRSPLRSLPQLALAQAPGALAQLAETGTAASRSLAAIARLRDQGWPHRIPGRSGQPRTARTST